MSLTITPEVTNLAVEITTGTDLFDKFWDGFGIVLAAVVLGVILFKYFVGQSKDYKTGTIALVLAAIVMAFVAGPQMFIDIGTAIVEWLFG